MNNPGVGGVVYPCLSIKQTGRLEVPVAAAFRLRHQSGAFNLHAFSGKRHHCQQTDGQTWGVCRFRKMSLCIYPPPPNGRSLYNKQTQRPASHGSPQLKARRWGLKDIFMAL